MALLHPFTVNLTPHAACVAPEQTRPSQQVKSITAKRMISGLVLKYLNGECFVIRRGYETTLPVSTSFCLTVPYGGLLEVLDLSKASVTSPPNPLNRAPYYDPHPILVRPPVCAGFIFIWACFQSTPTDQGSRITDHEPWTSGPSSVAGKYCSPSMCYIIT